MKFVAESLEEMNEGKFGKGLAMAGMAASMALSPMNKASAQTSSQEDKNQTEISSETKELTPLLKRTMSIKEKDGNYIIKVEVKSRSQSTLRRMAQMTANSEALYQQNPGKRKVEGFVSGSKVTDSDYFREGTTYIGEITVTIPIDGIETKIAEMKGGKGEYLDPNEVDQDQLAVGDEVEMEHTDDPEIADEIALDHLAEIPDYYTKLVAAGLVDELEAIKLHNELFGEV